MSNPNDRIVTRTPALPTRPAPLQPLARSASPTRVLEHRRAPRQLSLLFTR